MSQASLVSLPKCLTDRIVSLLLKDFSNLYKEYYFVSKAFDLSVLHTLLSNTSERSQPTYLKLITTHNINADIAVPESHQTT